MGRGTNIRGEKEQPRPKGEKEGRSEVMSPEIWLTVPGGGEKLISEGISEIVHRPY